MPVWAGIDEAGYGPSLGPLVLATVAVREVGSPGGSSPGGGSGSSFAEPPNLWARLTASVTDRVPTGRAASPRLVIADSKLVFRAGDARAGLARLEEAALSALLAGPAGHAPRDVGGLWAGLSAAWPGADGQHQPPWYGADFAARALPTAARRERINGLADAWADNLRRAGLALSLVRCRPVTESDFNRRVAETANKATAHLGWTMELLRELWRTHRGEGLLVAADKLGGRNFYAVELSRAFPEATVRTLSEGSAVSRYRLTVGADAGGPADEIEVRFEAKADRRNLPTALAAMVAKYVRELTMLEFNRWWGQRLTGLAPTAGYPVDAERFLSEVAAVAESPPRPLWVRCR